MDSLENKVNNLFKYPNDLDYMDFKKEIDNLLKKELKYEVYDLIEIPPDYSLGDYALPCFTLAKQLKKNPVQIAQELSAKLKPKGVIEKITPTGPYVNFFIKKDALAEKVLTEISKEKECYGSSNIGKGKTIVVEMSSPNIAKPFGIGHLRSTIIGESLNRIHKFSGYKTIRINHLGDWGTQFGNLIYAYRTWGDQKKLKQDSVAHLFNLYVKFHKEAEENPDLEEEGRKEFKKLEENDKENKKLWEEFTKISLEEFKRLYRRLDVDFEYVTGESFYFDKTDEVVRILKKKGLAVESEGALVVELEKDKSPAMLLKSDGASTYCLRDLATASYRLKTYKPTKILYVVGREQTLHFNQVFSIMGLLDESKEIFEHIPFGLYRIEGKKMTSRGGKVIFMEDVLNEATERALKVIKEKNPELKDKEKVADVIGIGSIIFGDLINDRVKDIDFDWDEILDFEGATAPYLQYTYARATSIVEKAKYKKPDFSKLETDTEKHLILELMKFPDIVNSALKNYKPHIIAQYLLDTAQKFNEFYHSCPVLKAKEDVKNTRLMLVDCTRQVIRNGLYLLNVRVVDEM